MLHKINPTSLSAQSIMQNGLDATKVTFDNQPVGYTVETAKPVLVNNPEPSIALGGVIETILAVAVLIRSVAFLIQVIGQLRKPKTEPKADSQ